MAATPAPGNRIWLWLERHSTWLLVLMVLLFIVAFSIAAVRKFQLFRVGFDVALIHQAVWNTAHGRFLESHAYDFTDSLLGTDSFFMAAWLAPLYALFPSVHTLFIAQVVIVALGALPLYLLARDRLGPLPGLIIAALYFLYLPVEYGTLYEIRFRMMAMAWLCFVLLFIERERYWAMLPFLFLALSCRLDTTIAVAVVGLYALLRRKRWFYGATLIVAAVGWYLVMTRLIIPPLSTRGDYMFLEHYQPLGSTPAEILSTAVRRPLLVLQTIFRPQKLWYLFQMGLPLLFLPFFNLPVLIAVLPLFLLNLLSSRSIQWDIYHHYQGLIVPLLMVGTILVWGRLARCGARQRRRGGFWGRVEAWVERIRCPSPWQRLGWETRTRLLGLVLLAASLVANLAFYNPLPPLLFGHAPERTAAAQALIDQIPPDAAVAASNLLAPHVPVRRDIYLVPGGDFYYAERPAERADVLLLDLESERGAEEAALMERVLAQGDWQIVDRQAGYVLLARQPQGGN